MLDLPRQDPRLGGIPNLGSLALALKETWAEPVVLSGSPGAAAPGYWVEMQILRLHPTPDPLNEKVWDGAPKTVV